MQVNLLTNTNQKSNSLKSKNMTFTGGARSIQDLTSSARSIQEDMRKPGIEVMKLISKELKTPEMVENLRKLQLIINKDKETITNESANVMNQLYNKAESFRQRIWLNRSDANDLFNQQLPEAKKAELLLLEKTNVEHPEYIHSQLAYDNLRNQRALEYILSAKIITPCIDLSNSRQPSNYPKIAKGFEMLTKMVEDF